MFQAFLNPRIVPNFFFTAIKECKAIIESWWHPIHMNKNIGFQFHDIYTNRFSRPRRADAMAHNRMVPWRFGSILIQIPHCIAIQILYGTLTIAPGAGAPTTNTTHCSCLTRETCPCPITPTTTKTKQKA